MPVSKKRKRAGKVVKRQPVELPVRDLSKQWNIKIKASQLIYLKDDPDFRFTPYNPVVAYGQSKTACILMSAGIAARWAGDGIMSNALNPGAIATNLQRYTGGLKTPEPFRKTPQQGAATSVLLAASPVLEGVTGHYFDDCNEAETVDARRDQPIGTVARYALDPQNADRLWTMAERMIGGAS